MSMWTNDDLFFLEAAYVSGMTLPDTARMLRRPQDEVRLKAAEQGLIERPSTVPDARTSEMRKHAPALSE